MHTWSGAMDARARSAAAKAEAEPAPAFTLEEAAFRATYDAVAPALRGYLARLTADAALADDLLQETFIRLLRARLPQLSEAAQRAWLYKVGTNLACDHARRSRRRPQAPLDEAAAVHDAARPPDGEDVRRAIRALSGNDQRLIALAYLEDATHVEIAAATGVKASSVRVLLFRARQRLARILRERGLAPGED